MTMETLAHEWHWFVHPSHLASSDSATVFGRSFEEIASALEQLPRMFFEPDGSFVWRTPHGQLDGQLHDSPRGCRMIELKGYISREGWHTWLSCLNWPQQPVSIQMARAGTILAEPDFAQLLS